MNAGCYGTEFGDVLIDAHELTRDGKEFEVSAENYR